MSNVLLIDADIVIYQQAASNQVSIQWDDEVSSEVITEAKAVAAINDIVAGFMDKLDGSLAYMVVGDRGNFRKELNPDYKAFRKKKEKPKLLYKLHEYVTMNYKVVSWERLEADDVMGILSTGPLLDKLGTPVVVSIDKDMRQIPGKLYNPFKPDSGIQEITLEEANHNFFMQVLTGDSVDGYKGIPGVGPKKAEKILTPVETGEFGYWDLIVEAYEAKGMTEEDALLNARMARILRWEDYDYDSKEVQLWMP
jgi:DNA polymerase-1